MDYLEEIKKRMSEENPLYIKVRILSRTSTTEIYDKMEDGTYKIKVAEIPVKGRTNAALLKFLKKELKAKEASIVSGGREKTKLIKLT